MKKNLKISLLQTDLVWQNPIQNHRNLERYFSNDNPTDLIILPEMFSTGFTRDYTEKAPYPSLEWLQNLAKNQNCSVYGSVALEQNNLAFNRGFWVNSDQTFEFYDKKHLFKYGKEHHTFSSGEKIIKTNIENWSFRPLICYDLRFPIWARNTAPYYDVLIYIASWPETRIEAWKALLKARAIENQCYVIGVNRLGTDAYNLNYNGNSCVFDFNGQLILDPKNEEGRFDVELSYQDLIDFRQKFPFLEDADSWQFI